MTLEYWSVSGECSIWSAQEIWPGQLYARCLGQDHLSSDQHPGYLLYLGDVILPSHKGILVRISRIPRKPTRAFRGGRIGPIIACLALTCWSSWIALLAIQVKLAFLGFLPSLKPTVCTWKWMVGIRSIPFGSRPIFRGDLLASGTVNVTPEVFFMLLNRYPVSEAMAFVFEMDVGYWM